MLRHELCVAIASNISNTIHCIHKCNVKLHELDVYVYIVSIIIVVTGPSVARGFRRFGKTTLTKKTLTLSVVMKGSTFYIEGPPTIQNKGSTVISIP